MATPAEGMSEMDIAPAPENTPPLPVGEEDAENPWQTCQGKKRKVSHVTDHTTTTRGGQTQAPTTTPNKKVQIKPFYVYLDTGHTYPTMKRALDAALTKQWHCTARGKDTIQVATSSIPEYHAAIQAVKTAGFQHSVLLQKDEIPQKFVLCKVPARLEKEFLQEEFARGNIPVSNFYFLTARNKTKMDKLVIEVPKDFPQENIRDLRYFAGLRIRVEDFRYSKDPPQCSQCQRYWHINKGCHAHPVCRWCGDPHETTNCPKGGQPEFKKCAHCNEAHCANYKGCKAFKNEKWRNLPEIGRAHV